VTAVLALLLALPTCWADRAEPGRVERLGTIAHAIEASTPSVTVRARLIATAYAESRFCRSVHAGTRKGGRGEGLWQIEPGSHRSRPYSGLTPGATDAAAASAAYLLEHSAQCGPGDAAVLTAYAGRPCGVPWASIQTRVNLTAWARRRLEMN
jgi:hypothetical protein